MQFTSEGQKKFAEATGNIAARTDGTNIMAIVMDNQVISSPSVSSQIEQRQLRHLRLVHPRQRI